MTRARGAAAVSPRAPVRHRGAEQRIEDPDLRRAVDGYLDHLRIERGLSPATLTAYHTDLRAFGRDAGPGWAGSPEAALRHLAEAGRRGRPGVPGLAPTSLRRRAAAIRGFYRFAY